MQRLNADANGVRRRPLVVGWQLTAEIGLLIKTVTSRCGFRSRGYGNSFFQRHLGATTDCLRQEELVWE